MQQNELTNLAFYWSTQFVRSLYEEGARNVVISPGSRSTPLTLAFSSHPGFKLTVAIDERSAAFIALGQAKASGIPSVLVCTSGTAVANYTPAVYEAVNSGTPLIIASADRPPHLRTMGASQTIDQVKMFGDQTAFFHEVGEPSSDEKRIKRLEIAAKQAFKATIQHTGIAHLNFAFDKPFEPEADFLSTIERENLNHSKRSQTDYYADLGQTEYGEKFWSELIAAEHPLIVVGPTIKHEQTDFVIELAKILKAPILAEPGSNIASSKYIIPGYSGFLRSEDIRTELKPDLILRIGAFPISKAIHQLFEDNKNVQQIAFTNAKTYNDGDNPPHRTIELNSPLHIPDISGNAANSWLSKWKKYAKKFQTFRKENIQPATPLTDGYIFQSVSKLLPKKCFVMASNSFPVRDLSLFTDHSGHEIYVNRGAAGIDGITSTAIGLSKELNKTGVLFIGDIAFLHDVNALLSASLLEKPLVVVILNNGGGTIFRMLPVYRFKEKHKTLFETPQHVRIASICRGYHVDHTLVSKPDQFLPAFEEYIEQPGLHVIECITDADDSMLERHTLWNFSNSMNNEG